MKDRIDVPTVTSDRVAIKLNANVGKVADAARPNPRRSARRFFSAALCSDGAAKAVPFPNV